MAIKPNHSILVAISFVLCNTIAGQDYTPTKESVPDISRYKALIQLYAGFKKCANNFCTIDHRYFSMDKFLSDPIIDSNKLEFYFGNAGGPLVIYFSKAETPPVKYNKTYGFHICLPAVWKFTNKTTDAHYIINIENDIAKQIVNALYILKNKGQMAQDQEDQKELENFKVAAQQYRSLVIKPGLNEETRRLLVQATTATEEKKYMTAIGMLEEAIKSDPVNPQAYFNQALLWAQLNIYEPAILEMKKYLLLVPDAADARASQDKIYEWEGKLNK